MRTKWWRQPAKRLMRAVKVAWCVGNDRWLNIYTEDYLHRFSLPDGHKGAWRGRQSSDAKFVDNLAYAAIDYHYLRLIIRKIGLKPTDVVYDLGSGLGRVLCMVARQRVARCIGVELFADMCIVARENISRLRGKKSPVEVICADATKADFDSGTVFFFFNPFGKDTMRCVLDRIGESVSRKSRDIRVVYYNPYCRELFDACPWLRLWDESSTWTGMRVLFYRSSIHQAGNVPDRTDVKIDLQNPRL